MMIKIILLLLFIDDKMDDLLSDLNEFEKSLYRAENHLTTVESRTSSIIDTLVNLGFCKSTEKFVSLIPKSVLVHHYVYFRMTLRRQVNLASILYCIYLLTHVATIGLRSESPKWDVLNLRILHLNGVR